MKILKVSTLLLGHKTFLPEDGSDTINWYILCLIVIIQCGISVVSYIFRFDIKKNNRHLVFFFVLI